LELTSFEVGTIIADYAIADNGDYVKPKRPIIGIITNISSDPDDQDDCHVDIHWMDVNNSIDNEVRLSSVISYRELYEELVKSGAFEDAEKRM
jgi:hypothetical protein